MNAKTRRKLEMAARALDFSRAHPDASPGYAAAMARLEERLGRAEQVVAQQRAGLLEVHAATARKRELRRTMLDAHLDHLVSVAKVAVREEPELAQKFVLTRQASTYLGFRTAARGMEAEAQARKELLVKHGLADQVLENLTHTLDQFDAAVAQGTEGRRAHVGASAELETVAGEIVQAVRVMDGLNRFRFGGDPESLAAWESASSVFAAPHPAATASDKPAPEGPPSTAGEFRPAA